MSSEFIEQEDRSTSGAREQIVLGETPRGSVGGRAPIEPGEAREVAVETDPFAATLASICSQRGLGFVHIIERMAIRRMDHVGIVVDDLADAVAFFVTLGLELQGEAPVEGDWVDRIVGLEGVQAQIAMLQTPDGHGRVELAKFHAPSNDGGHQRAPANASGIRHITFAVDDLDALLARLQARGAELVGELGRYKDSYRLCYVRGPAGIIVELAQPIG